MQAVLVGRQVKLTGFARAVASPSTRTRRARRRSRPGGRGWLVEGRRRTGPGGQAVVDGAVVVVDAAVGQPAKLSVA